MAEEFVPVIKIETDDAQMSVDKLKKRISSLKDEILNLDKGTDEYVRSVTELQNAQRRLDEVMSLTKKTATALDGSYDSLVHKMSLLKKEWRATNDEAKRNELGRQIEAINTQLKEFDNSIGNHQRNVGNYTESIQTALGGLETSTKSYGEAWGDMQKSTEVTRAKFEGIQKTASGVASGFAAVQGVMGLLGVENENLQKTFLKVQSAMAIAQGVGGLKDLVEGFSQLKTVFGLATGGLTAFQGEAVATTATMAGTTVATKASTTAVKGFRKALISTGIGAILVGIGVAIAAIIENWDKLTESLGFNKKKQEEVNEAIKESIEREKERKTEINKSVGEVIGKYRLLQSQWEQLSSAEEKNRWIKDNKQAFEELGLAINNTNQAQLAFVTSSDAVIKSIINQAKARAIAKLYEDAIARQYTAEQELADATAEASTKYKNGYKPTDKEIEAAGLGDGDFGTGTRETSLFEQTVLGKPRLVSTNLDWVDYSGAQKLQANFTKSFRDNLNVINGEVAKLEEAMIAAEQTAAESAAAVQALGIAAPTVTEVVETVEPVVEAAVEEVQPVVTDGVAEAIQAVQDKLTTLDNTYSNQSRRNALGGTTTKQSRGFLGSILGFGDADDLATQKTQEAAQSSALTAQYEAELEYLREKKKILEELLPLETDPQKKLQIQQQIADAEISMEEAKNDELNRLGEEANKKEAERQQKRQAIFAAGAQAASSLLTSIADAYESNEKTAAENEDKIKALRITAAVIDTIQGAVTAFASAQSLGPIAGPIVGAVNAAAVTAMGIANINKIKNTKIGDANASVDGSSGGSTGRATVSAAAYTSENPFNYTRQVTGASEVEELNREQRVYILESDIQESNRRVEIRENETSF